MEEGLQLQVLGSVGLQRDGEPVAVGGPKPRLLLAMLLAFRGAVVSADRLCEELWANQWLSLRHVFGILVERRDHLGAATLHGALTAAGAAFALPFEAANAERLSDLADDLRQQLGPAVFAAAVRRGASMTDAQIIGFVRGQIRALSA